MRGSLLKVVLAVCPILLGSYVNTGCLSDASQDESPFALIIDAEAELTRPIVAVAQPTKVGGVWTSAAELAGKGTSGPAWTALLAGANRSTTNVDIDNQDNRTGLYCFAAAIVATKDPVKYASYRNKAITCLDALVAKGQPSGRALAWARNALGYAATADLLDYRPPALVNYMRRLAGESVSASESAFNCSQFGRPLWVVATQLMPNNWGTLGLGSLTAIYAYLKDTTKLNQLYTHIAGALEGPSPYPRNRWDESEGPTWQHNPGDATTWRLITPVNLVKNGLILEGIIPEDMQRGGAFNADGYASWVSSDASGYTWETIQGLTTSAHILERWGYNVWALGDGAIGRAVRRYNVLAAQSNRKEWLGWGSSVRPWTLAFTDRAYGTHWAETALESGAKASQVYGNGRIAGWAYVIAP